jgi:nitrate reductase cytochrome c-type subunit
MRVRRALRTNRCQTICLVPNDQSLFLMTICVAFSIALRVPGVGIAPPNPHLRTPGLSSASRCQQCHVFKNANDVLIASTFVPLTQELHKGERLYATAPPVIPHGYFMREDCAACHAGAAARPETLCTHPERLNCLQCHARGSQP